MQELMTWFTRLTRDETKRKGGANMDLFLICVLCLMLGIAILFMAAAHKLEERHARWWEYHHPPDQTLEDDSDEQP